MTLLITLFAAIFVTAKLYKDNFKSPMHLEVLCFMYWGASLMWLVDAVAEYIQVGAEFFTPAFEDMINDAYLGACVVALGAVIWLCYLFIKDPDGLVKNALLSRKAKQ